MRAIREEHGRDPILGQYRFAHGMPAPRLRSFVRDYTGYADQASAVVRRRELPIADTVVIVNLGAPWRMLDPVSEHTLGQYDSFAAGTGGRFAIVEGTGPARCFHMNLTPLGGYRFFGVPMHLLSGSIFELDDLLDGAVRELREQLHEAGSWASAFDRLDTFIEARLQRGRAVSREVGWAVAELERTRGAARIGELTEQLGCSRKHLHQRFIEQIGTPAKQLAQLLRFGHAAERIERLQQETNERQLAALALECGYSDQAHLTREFRRFSGWTPGEYRTQLSVCEGYIVGPSVDLA